MELQGRREVECVAALIIFDVDDQSRVFYCHASAESFPLIAYSLRAKTSSSFKPLSISGLAEKSFAVFLIRLSLCTVDLTTKWQQPGRMLTLRKTEPSRLGSLILFRRVLNELGSIPWFRLLSRTWIIITGGKDADNYLLLLLLLLLVFNNPPLSIANYQQLPCI